MEKTNKELVAAGHELAKTLSADTPLIEIAKFVSKLATRLDVQVVLAQQLAAENAQASEIMTRTSMLKLEATAEGLFDAVAASNNPALIAAVNSLSGAVNATPELEATEAWLNEVRAQSFLAASDELKALAKRSEDGAAEHIHAAALFVQVIAAQLRAGEVSNG